MMQQTLTGCAFCDAPPGAEVGEAHTWGEDERVTHPICVACAIQTEPDPDERDHYACNSCGLVVDALAASPARGVGFQRDLGPARLTRFRVELGHLEGLLQLCAQCSPRGPATYWTRNLDQHLVREGRK